MNYTIHGLYSTGYQIFKLGHFEHMVFKILNVVNLQRRYTVDCYHIDSVYTKC